MINIWILEMKTTTIQNIVTPIKNNKGLKIVFAAIIAANYPVTFQMDEDKLYPMFYEQDMEKFIHEIPNLFVFAGGYHILLLPHKLEFQTLLKNNKISYWKKWIIQNVSLCH